MTDYFEVHERDGAARVGELRLDDARTTPALVDDLLEDAGSLWSSDRDVPEGDESKLTVLPHRAFPGGTAEEIQASFAVDHPDVDYPSVAVVSSEHVEEQGTDAYAVSDVQSITNHGAAFVEAVVNVRESIPADTALLFSGVATPRNVALLAYAGVDAVDATAAVVKGTEGRYLTTDEAYFLEDLEELPCSCSACQQPREEFTHEDCAEHNRAALEAELGIVRRRIRDGRLRDYLEGQARHDQWLTAAMRQLDSQWGYLEERTPILRDAQLSAATKDALRRVEIQRFADRVTTRYRNRFANPLVLVPCSATKPYSESQSYRQFHDVIQWRGHVVSMTSPIGVVPQELETTYPAQHYDTVVTGRWSEDEKEFVVESLRRYLERNADTYPYVVAHVPDEGYRDIVERVEDSWDGDLDITYTIPEGGHPTDDDALSNLGEALSGELKYSKREREHNTVRAIADYLLGDGAGDELFEAIQTTSRYPKIQVRNREDTQLATMVPQYGTLSFTLEGARRWVDSDAPVKRVEIDGFVPHGSVLAPGVVDADGEIRVGDEVVVEGPNAFAVGRAEMFGREMAESTRGVACEVRHVEEK
ncbi:archaeosine synthase subunit alpha [Natronobacterium gregoryi]|uniref:tRNA-ribosyltransferase n=2 Tax=Natronobacterium gregoryi TaxID=44930 RepID=L0AGK4_NATGS|nr:archaeosine synthase subunit alpha [Natronobacterium gregoryi]AFZ72282.1 queuine tRNA-ribosyltransferase [Natronobacterium gregoryi SP2]ELY62317.1 tRNA-guanine transglycosylase [Natronobacterium gregoryi SP2]PLK18664.1 tRNA-ribosyltransferase [Natronobacterium gregoryi SP2]SFJ67588.1 tRNA-archaeosine synthase [Natronobacterium gregoryi]